MSKEQGKKYDSGKPMPGTVLRVFPRAINAVGSAIEFGTHKYPNPNNWKLNEHIIERYTDSLVRHLTKYYADQEFDNETGLPHLAHMAWNALAILEYYLMNNPELVDKIMYPKEVKE